MRRSGAPVAFARACALAFPRVGLLTNPTAGRGRGAAYGAQTAAVLRAAGHEVVDLSGPDEATAAGRARQALDAYRIDVLAVVGGDGMVHLGANLCAGRSTPLAVVAAGSGNDNARELGLPVRAPQAAGGPGHRRPDARRRPRSVRHDGGRDALVDRGPGRRVRLGGQRARRPDALAARADALQHRGRPRAAGLPAHPVRRHRRRRAHDDRRDARRGRQRPGLRRRYASGAARVVRRRVPRHRHPSPGLPSRVPPRVPPRLPGNPRHPPTGADPARPPRPARGAPASSPRPTGSGSSRCRSTSRSSPGPSPS